jgi:TRAP-type C4-dicarboxylate transport system permease small subunit
VENPSLVYILIALGLVTASLLRAWLDKTLRLQGLFKFLGGLEITVIAVLLGSLVFFGCLQIVLRNFFHRGLLWADPLMRHTVLWLGCLGAVLATSKMRHINIDVFTRFLPPRVRAVRDRVIYFVTAFATSVLGFAALKLVIDEKEFGEKAFLNIDTWILQTVLPAAFFLISYRSLFNAWRPREAKPIEWDEFGLEAETSPPAGPTENEPTANKKGVEDRPAKPADPTDEAPREDTPPDGPHEKGSGD